MDDIKETAGFDRRRKIILTAIFAVFVISGISIQFPDMIHDYRAKSFVKKWVPIFTNCNTIDCVYTTSGKNPDFFYKRTFENGEWVLAVNTDTCESIGGFNASVFYGSDGAIYYQTGYKYCGQSAFKKALDSINEGELTKFYDKLPYELHFWKG